MADLPHSKHANLVGTSPAMIVVSFSARIARILIL